MDVVLITLGVLGLGAMLVSAWVFMVAARTYVSDDPNQQRRHGGQRNPQQFVERSSTDRRAGHPVNFPMMVNGILIEKDRRTHEERRAA